MTDIIDLIYEAIDESVDIEELNNIEASIKTLDINEAFKKSLILAAEDKKSELNLRRLI